MSSPVDSPFSYYQDSSPPTPSEFQYELSLATPPVDQYGLPPATTPESPSEPGLSSPPPPPPSPWSSPPPSPSPWSSSLPWSLPPPPPPPPPPPSKVTLAGVIAGCVIGFILLVLALYIYFRRKRGKRHDVVEIFPGEPPHEPKEMSAPSPATNSTSPLPPATNATSPPPPATKATSPPPPATNAPAPTSPSPPANATTPPPPTAPTESPPPPSPRSGTLPTKTNVAIIVGVGIGGFSMLVFVSIFFFFYRRRKRRQQGRPYEYQHEPKNDQFSGQPQHLQQNYTPPLADKVEIYSKPAHFPVPSSTSSSLSSEKPPSGQSPGIAFGSSQITFTYEELLMATNGFSNANLLGQGGFGYVHKGVLPNGKVVAIKQLKAGSGQGEREFQAEIEVISRVHHRHLVSLVGYCISGAQRMLIYEFVPNDTLEFHLHGKGRPTMNWPTRLKIALGSAKGLAYLHEDCQPKIIHRDIKGSNILLDYNFEAKVADFGLAKVSLDTDTHVSTRVMGTFGYLAPEYASSGKLTEKSDVFSFGVVLLELITGRQPIDKTQSFTDDSMVEWARPMLAQALETGNFDAIVDVRLQNDYNTGEMACMLACAAACVRHSGRRRPRMSQVIRALEGNLSPDELNEGVIPGHSTIYSSYGSSDYNTSEYKEDLQKFRKLALESQEQEQGTSGISGPSSEFDQHQSASSDEGQQTSQEIELGKTKKNTHNLSENS